MRYIVEKSIGEYGCAIYEVSDTTKDQYDYYREICTCNEEENAVVICDLLNNKENK